MAISILRIDNVMPSQNLAGWRRKKSVDKRLPFATMTIQMASRRIALWDVRALLPVL